MGDGTSSEAYALKPAATRALREFVRALETIEGVRLDAWDHVGLTLQQCRVLHVVEHEMHAPTQSDLARRLGVRPATVTLQLNRLVRLGLIQRIPDRADRRVRHVVVTECGRQVLGAMMHPPPRAVARVLAEYGHDEVQAMLMVLERLNGWVTRLAETTPPPPPAQVPATA